MRGKEGTKVKVLVLMFNLSFAFGNFLVLKNDGAHLWFYLKRKLTRCVNMTSRISCQIIDMVEETQALGI